MQRVFLSVIAGAVDVRMFEAGINVRRLHTQIYPCENFQKI